MTRRLVFVVSIFVSVGAPLCWKTAEARSKSPPPLLDEEGNNRPRNKSAECIFGKQVRELGSQWLPSLDGVRYCMKCECVPLRKKHRIVARVQCRSIKNECPVPTCDEPQLMPGRCCKVCPGEIHTPDVIHDVPYSVIEDEEKNTKHYAALLTGRSSLILKNDDLQPIVNENKNNVVATGRFTFQKRNLYYSFYISDKAARPHSLQFLDGDSTIMEEHTLSGVGGFVNSLYQNATRKVCGVWRRLPRDYRRLLKEERMFVALVWGVKDQAEFTLSGQVMKYVALGTELFSSLLEPAPGTNSVLMSGAGGTAIVSASTTVSPSIHIAVVFNGIFLSDEISDVPVNITLALDKKKQIILEEKVRVHKPAHELNLLEVSSPVSPADLRLLTRGRLVLSVTSISKPDSLRLSGNVVTKATCELFQSTLNSPSTGGLTSNPYGTSGLAWVYLNNEGSLVYNVQVENLHPDLKPVVITLVDVTTKRKMELEDLTPSFLNGWANGTVDKLSPRVLEPLYSGNLAVNVATENEISLIRGRLSARLVADARDAPAPVLLAREDTSLPASAVGLAWISVDNDCHLHYDVSLTGLGPSDRKLEVFLEFLPMVAPGAPVLSKYLDEFVGNQVEGSPSEILIKEELVRLDSGAVFIKIKENNQSTLLSAQLRETNVPATCLPHFSDNDIRTLSLDPDVTQTNTCFHEGKFFQEGEQWTTTDPCTMCFCQNGNARCDTSTCPYITCTSNIKINRSGECCPVCSDSTQESNMNTSHGCSFGGKFYSASSKFHPFLIPSGFDLCTECVCDAILLEVKCSRQSNDKMCCRNCVVESKAMIDSENGTYISDPSSSSPNEIPKQVDEEIVVRKTALEILSDGGCKNPMKPSTPYENGQKFHPWIASLGEYKCVTCKCKNGTQTCQRQRCTRQICRRMFRPKNNNYNNVPSTTASPINIENCCSPQQCKRFRRHHRARDV